MGSYSTYNESAEILGRLNEAKALKGSFIIANFKGERLYLKQLIEKKIVE